MTTPPPESRAADWIENLPSGWTVHPSGLSGVYLRISVDTPGCYHEVALGRIRNLRRFVGGHRHRPFWMRTQFGATEEQIEWETQWLLAETGEGGLVLVIPLLDGSTRFSLRGSAEGIVVCAETGDPQVATTGGMALWLGHGDDPYRLMNEAADAVLRHVGTGARRAAKPVADFVDHLGWCTWDAFYREVTAEKVEQGLASFARGGVKPRWMILDDGWQSVRRNATGEERLVRFEANERFGHDLTPLIQKAKQQYGIERFIVWHALLGYWGGLDPAALPAYAPRMTARSFGPGILKADATWNVRPWGALVGVPAAAQVPAFFDDYHRALAEQGVDGVKVDNQAMLEAVSSGQGGRVALARTFRAALEASVDRHFGGRLINCMSCTMEAAYLAGPSTVMRTSDDFYPTRPETHGEHVLNNAFTSLWLGEFITPDWDMFQSAHEAGAFHAAARVVSGGPVYVSDGPGAHDFALLRKLVLSDGTVLRCDEPGRPSRDSLFVDFRREDTLLKVGNRTRHGGVVGVFHPRVRLVGAQPRPFSGTVAPRDAPGLPGEKFVGFAHVADRVWCCRRGDPAHFTLEELGWEIVSFVAVENGFAALGLADKLNSTAAVAEAGWIDSRRCRVRLRDGGVFLAWAERAPREIACGTAILPMQYDVASGRLSCAIAPGGERTIEVRW